MRAFAVTALTPPPFASRLHPAQAAVARHTLDWAAGHQLMDTDDAAQRLALANRAELAARVLPAAADHELALLADLIGWLFAFDDDCDEGELGRDPGRLSPVVAGLMTVLDALGSGPPPRRAGPIGVALHDLCARLRGVGAACHLQRFVDSLHGYLIGVVWEAANRAARRVPTLAEYVQLRRHTGGVLPGLVVADIGHRAGPALADSADPAVRRLTRLTVDLVGWCNDLFSYAKERDRGDVHNLVVVLRQQNGGDEDSALRAAADRFNQRLEAYLATEREVLAAHAGDPGVDGLVAARQCWIRGTYDWSRHTGRYR